MYFGGSPRFEEATRTTIVQFKYSIADKDDNFGCSRVFTQPSCRVAR